MIKTIIFDFGDVFINLDKQAIHRDLNKLGIPEITSEMYEVAAQYEKGLITTDYLLQSFIKMFPAVSKQEFRLAWNSMILNFPEYRLEFISRLSEEQNFNLMLLSNTNELHIQQVIKNMSMDRYNRFKNCFNKFYLSHEIHLSKPNQDIYQFVLETNNLSAEETLFIDDTKVNTDAAALMGIHTWNNNPETEDIVDLFTIKRELF